MAKQTQMKRGLGRGLDTLIGDLTLDETEALSNPKDGSGANAASIPIEFLKPDPSQARKDFPEASLKELANSIAAKGIIQPIVARPDRESEGHYWIVAGERRWRAAQLAQLRQVPVAIHDLTDEQCLEISIIENIQREDLNPIEEAHAYRSLMERFGKTQENIAAALGKSRSHIANTSRLLKLPDEVQKMVREGKLTSGHARAVVTAQDPVELANQIVQRDLSVRQTEELSKKISQQTQEKRPPKWERDADTEALEAELAANLGSKVNLQMSRNKSEGKLVIQFKTLQKLEDLISALNEAASKLRDSRVK